MGTLRLPRIVVAMVTVAVLAGNYSAVANAHQGSAIVLPSSGAWFGAYVADDGHTGPDRQTSQQNFEAMVGRSMVTDRQYYRWDDAFPTPDDYWSRDQGRIPIWSWSSSRLDGTVARWPDISTGLYDAEIDARAQAIMDYAAPVFLAFHHEPKLGLTEIAGTPADYIAAWRYIHNRFEANGVTNVSWVLILTAQTYQKGTGPAFYPGSEYVDVVAADGFNWYGCAAQPGPWRSVQEIFAPFRTFALAHGKPMMIAEWGSGEDPNWPTRKEEWIRAGLDTFRSWPEVKVISYFHAAPAASCPRWVDTSNAALGAFSEIGADPSLRPPLPFSFQLSVTSGPAPRTTETTAAFTFSSSDPGVTFTCSLDGASPEPCPDGYSSHPSLTAGPHAFWVRGVDALGREGYATWLWTIVPVVSVSAADLAFTPRSVLIDQDVAVRWGFDGPSQHTVTDSTGMELFDSGTSDPGGTFTFVFTGAGAYAYTCSLHPSMTGTIKVPVSASPTFGGTTTAFAIAWASADPPPRLVYDLQIHRPDSAGWTKWRWSQIGRSAAFVPDVGPGTYSFRARLREPAMAKRSGWSTGLSIIVG